MVFSSGNSIQDFVKNINSRVSPYDVVSMVVTVVILFGAYQYILMYKAKNSPKVHYFAKEEIQGKVAPKNFIFASKNGETYTYTWCSGAQRIQEKNRVYFSNEEEAQKTGRRLSKMCQ